jgi:methylenetetrahydrofolate reductase (NADPH)
LDAGQVVAPFSDRYDQVLFDMLLRPLVASARIELVPIGNVVERAIASLPEGARLSVTCLPKHGPVRAVDTALELRAAGFDVVPHLAARSVESRGQLGDLVARCVDAGIDEYFVIGGDRSEPAGTYPYASALIEDLNSLAANPKVGVGGYPEVHPAHDDEGLILALLEKQRLGAAYVVSQMCFDGSVFSDWAARIRGEGIELPIVFGVPGVVERKRLIEMSAKIGVGGALKFMRGKRRMIISLLASRHFEPGPLIRDVTAALPPEEFLAGLHLYSFNQLELTAGWIAKNAARV